MKEKWVLRSDRKENKGCPLIILADMDRSDLTDALDMLESLIDDTFSNRTHIARKDKIETFLTQFRKQ